jgi:hypothetical protein
MTQKINLICLDVDGLLTPFKPTACKKLGIPCEADNMPSDELVYELAGGKKNFWTEFGTHNWFANLPLYQWSLNLVDMVDKSGIDWIFLTKCSLNHGVASGKCEFIDRFFKKHKNRLWMNKGSKSYMSGPGRLLVDDKMEPNGTEWLAAHKDAMFYHWSELHPSQTEEAARRIAELKLILTQGV